MTPLAIYLLGCLITMLVLMHVGRKWNLRERKDPNLTEDDCDLIRWFSFLWPLTLIIVVMCWLLDAIDRLRGCPYVREDDDCI